MKRKGSHQAGFTLIEMLVAISIFVMVAFVITVAFLNLTNAYRKSQSIRLVTDNLNFAMDSMALKLREAERFGGSCTQSSCQLITAKGQYVGYKLHEGRIKMCTGTCDSYQPITASNVEIKELNFDTLTGVNLQPSVRLFIRGEADIRGQKSDFKVQTVVSLRNY